MFILEMLVVAVIGFITYTISSYIVKVTKINAFIIYLIIGIILGVSGFGILNNAELMGLMAEYNELISLVALMFGAGLSLNYAVIKKAGSKVGFLSIVPLYVETIVMGFVLTFLVNLIPIGFEINVFEGMLIAVLVGPTQPSVVFSSLFRRISAKKSSVNNAESTFLLASVVENFTGIPIIFALLSIIMGLELSGGTVDAIGVAKNVVLILVAIVISAVIVFGLGYVYGLLVKKYANNLTDQKQIIIFTFVSLIVNIIIVMFSGPLTALSILFGLMFGMALNFHLKNEVREKCQHVADEIFVKACAPIIFLSVGASIELSKLLSLNLVLVAALFYVISVALKNIVMRVYLKKQGFTSGEMNYIGFSYLAKGVGAINVVGVLTAIIASTQLETDTLLSYIAIIEILISFVIYTSFIKKYENTWLDQEK